MVANGGHKLAFHVTPGHLPAIVLDAGGGADSSYWQNIVPKLARNTGSEIITYDRAGLGASDEVPGPWRAQDAVSDLAAGLTQLGATHDVLLVSHSLAGEIATYFVNENPHWVTGAVLVDASLPDFYTDSEVTRIEAANQAQIAQLKKQPSTKQTRQLLAVASNYGPAHRAYHKISWPNEVPSTVIASSKTPFDTPEDAQLWRDAQAHFAGAAPNRQLVVARNSSHDIPIDRPDVVITAVEDMARKLGAGQG
jgi:pimeloyl-ACP methyl ester carboxylesterase